MTFSHHPSTSMAGHHASPHAPSTTSRPSYEPRHRRRHSAARGFPNFSALRFMASGSFMSFFGSRCQPRLAKLLLPCRRLVRIPSRAPPGRTFYTRTCSTYNRLAPLIPPRWSRMLIPCHHMLHNYSADICNMLIWHRWPTCFATPAGAT